MTDDAVNDFGVGKNRDDLHERVHLEDFSQGVRLDSTSRSIYMPFTTALRKFEHDPIESLLDEIMVRVGENVYPWYTASVLEPLLANLHGGVGDYELVVPEALLEQSRRTQRLFKIVMGCIARISLLVGGLSC